MFPLQDKALHLLPPTDVSFTLSCLQNYTTHQQSSSSAVAFQHGIVQGKFLVTHDHGLADVMLRSLVSGELGKAQHMSSVSWDVAVSCMSAVLTDPTGEQDTLPHVIAARKAEEQKQAILNKAVSSFFGDAQPEGNSAWEGLQQQLKSAVTGQEEEQPGGKGTDDERKKQQVMRAMSMARRLVQGLHPSVLNQFMERSVELGWNKQALGTALAHACRGDLQCMDKLKAVLR